MFTISEKDFPCDSCRETIATGSKVYGMIRRNQETSHYDKCLRCETCATEAREVIKNLKLAVKKSVKPGHRYEP